MHAHLNMSTYLQFRSHGGWAELRRGTACANMSQGRTSLTGYLGYEG